MTTVEKVFVSILALLVMGALVFIIYKQNEISVRQQAIETQIVSQKELIDGIVRSQSQWATKDDLSKWITSNGINLKAIQADLDKLHASVTAANVISVISSGQNTHSVPSSGTGPVNPIDSPTDTYGYLKTMQLLDLHENFGDVSVPIGQIGFSAWQSAPWSITILPREYKVVNIIGTDENQRAYVYNKVTVKAGDKNYDVKITSAETKQEYPDAKWNFWNPKLFLGLDGGINIQQPVIKVTGQVTPSINFGFISYGRYKTTPDLSFAQVGFGLGMIDAKPQVVITPVAYNIGKHVPFISNTYIAPSLGVGINGSFNVMAGIRIGL
jgi:hypothetical protein